jgi:Family of unknown function (DUF6544)
MAAGNPRSGPGRRTLVLAAPALLAGVAAAWAVSRVAFDRRVAGEVQQLVAASKGRSRLVAEADLVGLPEPVQQWLRWSNVLGTPYPVTVRLRQEGQFRMGQDRGWMPFTAQEYYTTDPPGYLWAATFTMAPLVTVRGRDRYAEGQASIDMRLLSLIPVANDRGPGLNQGDLLRYLNEAEAIAEALDGLTRVPVRPLLCVHGRWPGSSRSFHGGRVAGPRQLVQVVRSGSPMAADEVERAAARLLELLRPAA